jgi:hypothetical protein
VYSPVNPVWFSLSFCVLEKKQEKSFYGKMTNVQYPCKMSDGKIKRPLDIIAFVKWISNCPLDCRVSIGSNGRMECPTDLEISIGILFVYWSTGQMECPLDICFFSWLINMYLNDVMTSIWREIAKRKCPLDPLDLEMSIVIFLVNWIQWTSGISIGHLLFQWFN